MMQRLPTTEEENTPQLPILQMLKRRKRGLESSGKRKKCHKENKGKSDTIKEKGKEIKYKNLIVYGVYKSSTNIYTFIYIYRERERVREGHF